MTVHHLPLPELSDEEFEYLQADSIGRLLAKTVDLEIELSCVRSWAGSLQGRLEATQVRRLRFLIAGAFAGALIAWGLDGKAAEKLHRVWPIVDRALSSLGWIVP